MPGRYGDATPRGRQPVMPGRVLVAAIVPVLLLVPLPQDGPAAQEADAPSCAPGGPPVELDGEVGPEDARTYQVHPFEVVAGTTGSRPATAGRTWSPTRRCRATRSPGSPRPCSTPGCGISAATSTSRDSAAGRVAAPDGSPTARNRSSCSRTSRPVATGPPRSSRGCGGSNWGWPPWRPTGPAGR
jgi:hypothetical protein